MSKPAEVIMVYEGAWDAIVNNLSTFVTVVGIIGVGVWLESPAMQWAGFIIAALIIGGRAARFGEKYRYTIAGARKKLDELEGK